MKKVISLILAVFILSLGIPMASAATVSYFTPIPQSYFYQDGSHLWNDVIAVTSGDNAVCLTGKGGLGKNASGTFGVGAKFNNSVSLIGNQFSFTLNKDLEPAVTTKPGSHWFRMYFVNQNDYIYEGNTNGSTKGLILQIQYYAANTFNITLLSYDDTRTTKLAGISNAGIAYTKGTPLMFKFVANGLNYDLQVGGVTKYTNIDLSTLLPDGKAYFASLVNPGTGYVINGSASDTYSYTVGVHSTTVPTINFNSLLVSASKVVTNVSADQSVDNFLANITDNSNVVRKVKDYIGNEITGQSKVGTGSTVEFFIDNVVVASKRSIIIYGDVSGDGAIDVTDLVAVKKHLLKISLLTGSFAKAADTQNKGSVTVVDLLAVKKSVLNVTPINQNIAQ